MFGVTEPTQYDIIIQKKRIKNVHDNSFEFLFGNYLPHKISLKYVYLYLLIFVKILEIYVMLFYCSLYFPHEKKLCL